MVLGQDFIKILFIVHFTYSCFHRKSSLKRSLKTRTYLERDDFSKNHVAFFHLCPCFISKLFDFHECKLCKYADDISFLHFIRTDEDDSLQSEWSHLEAWSSSVGLTLNSDKSFVLNYVTTMSLNLQPVTIHDGVVISTVSSIKLLGLTMSCDFSWNTHIDSI